jgi:hypothetical protein
MTHETGGVPDRPGGDAESALESAYLDRLLLQNEVFGDQIELLGVAVENGKPVVLTAQPAMIGQPPGFAEITAFLTRLWFRPLTGLHLGNPGALAFYRDLDELAVFDAHPANFVQGTQGVVLPIDLVLVRADAALQEAIKPSLVEP